MDCSSSDLESESDSERVSEAGIIEEEKKEAGASGSSSCQKSVNRASSRSALASATSSSNKHESKAQQSAMPGQLNLAVKSERLDFYLNARSKLVILKSRSSEGDRLPNDLSSLSRKKGLLEPSSMLSSSYKGSLKVSPFIIKKQ